MAKLRDIFLNPTSLWSKIFNLFFVGLVIISVTTFPLFFFFPEGVVYDRLILFEKMVVTFFLLEYIGRILLSSKPISYIFSKHGLLDLFCLLPYFLFQAHILPFFPFYFLVFRFFRLLSFVRISDEDEMVLIAHYGHYIMLPGEKLQKIVQRHEVVFLVSLVVPLFLTYIGILVFSMLDFNWIGFAVAFLFLAFALLFYFLAWLNYRYDVLIITDRRIVVQNRELFGARSNNVDYEDISDIIMNNDGFLKWLFGYGTIIIKVEADTDDIHYDYIPGVKQVMYLLSRNRENASHSNK